MKSTTHHTLAWGLMHGGLYFSFSQKSVFLKHPNVYSFYENITTTFSRLLVSKLSLTGLASFPRPHCVRLSAIALQSSLSTQAFGNGSLRKKRKFFFSSLDKIWKGRGWLWSKEDRLSGRFRQTWPLAKVQIYSMCLLSFRALDTGDQWPIVITINSNMLFTAPAILLKFTFLCIGILPETRYFLLAFYWYFRENLDSVIFLRPRWQPCMAIQWIHNLKYFSQVRLCHLPSLVFSPKTLENQESPEVNTLKGGGKLIVLLCCNLTEEVLNVCESQRNGRNWSTNIC